MENSNLEDTIVAISTPYGKSGIGVVRLSGNDSLKIALKMFFPLNKNFKIKSNSMILGNVDLGEVTDKCFMVYFKNPKSFTGEDVVEFQCHGGLAVTQRIVEKCLSLGARLAMPGEFSKRAFLNGKMSLDQAEGVIDTINAETESELKASNSLEKGILTATISVMQDSIVDLLSEIEVNLDYPEHDIEYKTKGNIIEQLKKILGKISTLLNTQKQGKFIRNGINVAIIGKTNVGKSSLLNALLGTDYAIVTDVEGTTRDIVIGSLEYKGFKFNFLDTAGIRNTKDKVESIGIEKSKKALNESDIVLLILDGSRKFEKQDYENLKMIENKKALIILNKCDLKIIDRPDKEYIMVSAKENINTDEIKEKIYQIALNDCNQNEKIILTNLRHIEILSQAKIMIEKILKSGINNSLDCISLDVRELWEKLGEITGETVSEVIIDRIFSKFCLGK